jgi:hypothetical protein
MKLRHRGRRRVTCGEGREIDTHACFRESWRASLTAPAGGDSQSSAVRDDK